MAEELMAPPEGADVPVPSPEELPTPPTNTVLEALLGGQGLPSPAGPTPAASLGELMPVLAQFLQLLGDSFKTGADVGAKAADKRPAPRSTEQSTPKASLGSHRPAVQAKGETY